MILSFGAANTAGIVILSLKPGLSGCVYTDNF